MIRIKQLQKSYGSKQVLHSINLTFEKGKVYGVVGENGAGKTTLFKCLAQLEKHNGNIVSDLKPLKNNLAYLPTTPYIPERITGLEYLQLLCSAREKNIGDFETQNIFNLPLKEYASKYSTGMKKKLALTGVLLQKNDVYILDEPFNGVDIQSNILITEIIKKLKALSKTIIISSHIFSTLSQTCDTIFLLKNGTIIKEVMQEDFNLLEEEMKTETLLSQIDKLDL